MQKKILIAVIALSLAGLAGVGAFMYQSWFGEPAAPSGPITAAPIENNSLETSAALPGAAPMNSTAEPERIQGIIGTPEMPEPKIEAMIPDTATIAPTPPQPAAPAATDLSPRTFRIVPDASMASFNIYEDLRGKPKDVIGTTNQVAGEVSVDFGNLATARLGEIRVNARTFKTDDERRNRAIQNRILETEAHEFITFTPAQITGLSGAAAPNKVHPFTMTGNLTIRGVTKPVTWEGGVMAVSETELRIEARTTVKRSDYQISVPNLPFIANVADDVALEFKGAARAAAN